VRKSILAVVFLVICPLLFAQQALNNDSVIKLIKAGLSDDLVISTINSQAGKYDTSTDGLIALKTAGVSDRVVSTIVAKVAEAAQPAPPPIPPLAPMPVAAPAIVAHPATAPAGTQEAATATVHFYRYKQYMGSALKPSVYCDNTELGRLGNGHYLDVKIPVGPHTLYAEDKQAGAAVTLEDGKDYYFRTDVQIGFWKGHFRLTMVMPEQGKYDVEKLTPLDSKDAVHEVPPTAR
jgi:hypothetical protein